MIVIYSRTNAASYGTIKTVSRINQMMKNMTQNKVIVVGAGMVGAAMAIKLAQQGKSVQIIEKKLILKNI